MIYQFIWVFVCLATYNITKGEGGLLRFKFDTFRAQDPTLKPSIKGVVCF